MEGFKLRNCFRKVVPVIIDELYEQFRTDQDGSRLSELLDIDPQFCIIFKQEEDVKLRIRKIIHSWIIINEGSPRVIDLLKRLETNGMSTAKVLAKISILCADFSDSEEPGHIPRYEETKAASKIFYDDQSLLVYGENGSGKTYFVKRLLKIASQDTPLDVFVWLDFNNFSNSLNKNCAKLGIEMTAGQPYDLVIDVLNAGPDFVILDGFKSSHELGKKYLTLCKDYQREFYFKLIVITADQAKIPKKNSLEDWDVTIQIKPFDKSQVTKFMPHLDPDQQQLADLCGGNPARLNTLNRVCKFEIPTDDGARSFIINDLITRMRKCISRSDSNLDLQEMVKKLTGRSELEKEKSRVFHGVPPQDVGLVGRDAELIELDNFRIKKFYKVVYISGLSGEGKTQHVVQYVTLISKDFNICWLSAHNVTTLTHSLTKFASDELHLKTDDLDKMTFPELMSTVLTGMDKLGQEWVTVLDNVDERFLELVTLVKHLANATKSFTIVTSRRNNILKMNPNMGHMKLGGLQVEDAIKLITSQINDIKVEEAKELWEIAAGHCFTLQQFISFIRQEKIGYQCSIPNFLTELHRDKSLGVFCKALEYEMEIHETTEIILTKTLAILDPVAREYLYILSYMHSKNVPLDLASYIFHAVFNTEKADHEVSIRKFKKYNLVSVENNAICTHQLVQWVARRALNDNDAKKSEIELKLLNSMRSDSIGKVFNRKNAFHLVTIYDQIQLSIESVEKVPDVEAVRSIFEKLRDVSALRDAFNFIKKELPKFCTALGTDNKDTLQVEGLLYQAMIHLGRYNDAVKGLKPLFSKLNASQGLNHDLTLYVGNDLARALHFSGDVDQAINLGEKVFFARKELLGERHEDTLISGHNLTIYMSDLKQFKEAGAIHEKIYQIRSTDFGEKNKSTLNSRHQVAYCKLQHALQLDRKSEEEEEVWVGLITEMKQELEEISKIRVSVLGEDHTETLRTQHWLGVAMINLHDSKERDKAVVILNKVLEKRVAILGKEHVETIATKKLIDETEEKKRDEIDFRLEIYE